MTICESFLIRADNAAHDQIIELKFLPPFFPAYRLKCYHMSLCQTNIGNLLRLLPIPQPTSRPLFHALKSTYRHSCLDHSLVFPLTTS